MFEFEFESFYGPDEVKPSSIIQGDRGNICDMCATGNNKLSYIANNFTTSQIYLSTRPAVRILKSADVRNTHFPNYCKPPKKYWTK